MYELDVINLKVYVSHRMWQDFCRFVWCTNRLAWFPGLFENTKLNGKFRIDVGWFPPGVYGPDVAC